MSSISETTAGTRPVPAGRIRFETGQVLSGRYRIVGPLRAGRLDEAYRAEDQETGREVALKVLRRANAPLEPGRSLVRTMRRLAALDHCNVARTLDLSVHTAVDLDDGVSTALFVTSELVEGEPLGSYVRSARPLDRDQARSLIDGICSGLAAIHRKRLVHGDLNSAAITLVRQGDLLTPVITDFAFAVDGEDARPPSIGSPVYRAPETLVGRPPDKASDVFGLGAVTYEILSGRIPFTGGNLLALDFRHLEEEPRSLRDLVDDLDPVLDAVVARCLSRAPEDRYANADEVRKAFQGRDSWTPRTRRSVGTLSAAAALVVIMFGGSALLDRVSELERRRLPIEVATYRPSFAILDVAPLGGDSVPWIAVALSELIRSEFSEETSLRVAQPDLVREYAGLTSPLTGAPDPDQAVRIRTLFDVEAIVIGTCSVDSGAGVPTVALDLCVIDARSGETIAAAFERGSPDGLPDLAARAASRVRGAIDLPKDRGSSVSWDPDAVRPWAEGLLRLREQDTHAAVESLEEAASLQPGNARIQDALAIAWSQIGSASRAAEAARRALEHSTDSPPEKTLERRATLALLEGRISRAIDERLHLARSFPDRPSHAYRLIETLLAAGATRPAAEEIRRLRMARATVDPRTEIADSRLHAQIGRFDEAILHADRAASIAVVSGSRTLRGEALLERAWAQAALGDEPGALATLREAESFLEGSLDPSGLTRAASIRAEILRRDGQLDAALRIYDELGDRFKTSGREQSYATTLGSRATILSLEGRHGDALTLIDDAINRFEALGDELNLVRAIGVSGTELLALGRLDEARQRFHTASEMAVRSNLHAWEGYAHVGLARVDLEKLDLDRAESEINRAVSRFGAASLGSSTAGVDIVRSELDRLRGRIQDAESRLTAIVNEREILARDRQAELHLSLARIALSSGRDDVAAALAQRAAEHHASTGNVDRQVESLTIVYRAVIGSGRRERLESITAQLDALAPRIESPLTGLRLRLARAGELGPARSSAERLAVHARSAEMGLQLLRLEAAHELRQAATTSADRVRWETEIEDLARRSGANLFILRRD